jgi:HemY protein
LPHLSRLRRGNVMSAADYERYEAGILARALAETSDAINLRSLWAELNRAQRREPAVATAYARRAASLKLGAEAAREIEGLLDKQWSESLLLEYARLGGDATARVRWLERHAADHPNSAGLMLALGRTCRELSLWGKAEDALQRALALNAGAPAFEELGQLYAAQGQHERANRAYENAFAAARGETPAPLPAGSRAELAAPPAIEERDQHGVPRLPGAAR